MKAAIIIFGVALLIIFILPTLAVSIASFVVAAQNMDATCDSTMVSLPVWLHVNGAVSLAVALFMICTFGAFMATLQWGVLIPFGVVAVLYSLFNFAWNVVGAVALFRDSMDCLEQTTPLWAMTLAVLILQWLTMISTCCGSTKIKSSIED